MTGFVEAFAALHPGRAPRILTVDLERVPGRVTLDVWEGRDFQRVNYVHPDRWSDLPRTVCVGHKWYDETRVGFTAAWDNPDDPYHCAREAWKLYDEADWVVTFNGRRADNRWLQQDWATLGLPRPTPWKDIDLFLVARRSFAFESKSLRHLCDRLDIPNKDGHYDVETARAAVAGDEQARKRLKRYNLQDVRVTEAAFVRLRPWLTGINWGLFAGHGSRVCPTCGANRMTRQRGTHTAITGRYEVWRCDECGSLARESKRSVSTPTRGV